MIPVIDDYVELEVEIQPDLLNSVKALSDKTGRSIEEIVQEALQEWIKTKRP